jgi:hypothetical protein
MANEIDVGELIGSQRFGVFQLKIVTLCFAIPALIGSCALIGMMRSGMRRTTIDSAGFVPMREPAGRGS